jgi:rubrerythrin
MSTREALEMAIADEAQARDKYHELARQAEDPESRILFEQLAREEESHHKRLSERLRAIKLLG